MLKLVLIAVSVVGFSASAKTEPGIRKYEEWLAKLSKNYGPGKHYDFIGYTMGDGKPRRVCKLKVSQPVGKAKAKIFLDIEEDGKAVVQIGGFPGNGGELQFKEGGFSYSLTWGPYSVKDSLRIYWDETGGVAVVEASQDTNGSTNCHIETKCDGLCVKVSSGSVRD